VLRDRPVLRVLRLGVDLEVDFDVDFAAGLRRAEEVVF
jgi:hypothetical protein